MSTVECADLCSRLRARGAQQSELCVYRHQKKPILSLKNLQIVNKESQLKPVTAGRAGSDRRSGETTALPSSTFASPYSRSSNPSPASGSHCTYSSIHK